MQSFFIFMQVPQRLWMYCMLYLCKNNNISTIFQQIPSDLEPYICIFYVYVQRQEDFCQLLRALLYVFLIHIYKAINKPDCSRCAVACLFVFVVYVCDCISPCWWRTSDREREFNFLQVQPRSQSNKSMISQIFGPEFMNKDSCLAKKSYSYWLWRLMILWREACWLSG